MNASSSTDYVVMVEARGLSRGLPRTTLERRQWLRNASFVLTASFGFGHLGSPIAPTAWAGLCVMPAALFPLLIEFMYSTLVLHLLLPSMKFRSAAVGF